MSKLAHKLTLGEWEKLLDRGPVTFRDRRVTIFAITITITRVAPQCYAWHTDLPWGSWSEVTAETLLELFLLQAFGDNAHVGETVIDANADYIASLPEASG